MKTRLKQWGALFFVLATLLTACGRADTQEQAARAWQRPHDRVAAAGAPAITGTFFQPYLVEAWTQAEWAAGLKALTAAGVDDHIIWQWTLNTSEGTAFYPTRLPGFQYQPTAAGLDPVRLSLEQAKAAGLQVWLGLNWSEEWWQKYADDPAWLKKEFQLAAQIEGELWQLYGEEYGDTLAGFYMPLEVDNVNFVEPLQQARIKQVYRDLADQIHQSSGKPLMISPYFSEIGLQKPAEWGKMWADILREAKIDVVNLQDGCGASDDGVTTHSTPEQVGKWFQATRKATETSAAGTQLWADLETFDMDKSSASFPLGDISRLERQKAAVAPYVSRISSFSVMHYQLLEAAPPEYRKVAEEQYKELKQQQGH